jgi:hypothetical protein
MNTEKREAESAVCIAKRDRGSYSGNNGVNEEIIVWESLNGKFVDKFKGRYKEVGARIL